MTTFAMPSLQHLSETAASYVGVDRIFESGPSASGQINPDLHFPENMFDFEELVEVDDLLNDLGMLSQPVSSSLAPAGEGNGPATTEAPASFIQEHHRSVSPSSKLSEISKGQFSTTASPLSGNSVVRAVSVDHISSPTSFSSVPNPMQNQYIPPRSTFTQRPAAISPERHTSLGQKRKHIDLIAEKDLTVEEIEERRERNRTHAKKSRQRKKVLTEMLQESVEELKRENKKLREEVTAIIGRQTTEAIMAKKKEQNRETFFSSLMDPQNRVLDASGLAYMKKLRKCVPRD